LVIQITSGESAVSEREKKGEAQVPMSERLAYPVSEACILAGFKKSKAWELIKSGELKSIKRAGRRLILRSDLEAYLCGEAA
jgi:excisionase family DNA binding protein